METETLRMARLLEILEGRKWFPLIFVNGPVQEEAVQIFYANFFDINNDSHTFWTTVNGVLLKVSLDSISCLLGLPHVTQDLIAFSIHKLSIEQKGARVERQCG